MLFRRGDVAFGAIGQLDVEVRGEGRLRLQLQSGERIHFVGQRGDGQITDADGLQFDLGLLPLMQDDRLLGIDLPLVLGEIVLDLRRDRSAPMRGVFRPARDSSACSFFSTIASGTQS